MKYSTVIAMLPRLMSAHSTEDYVCTGAMLRELCEQWGLKPTDKKRGTTLYDREDVDAAINRKKRAEAE